MATTAPFAERRKHRRFIVSGRVRFATGFDSVLANLVNLGQGGILIRSQVTYPEGTKATFHVSPHGCPYKLEVEGQVVGAKDGLMAVQFLEERPEISDCIQWLVSENCPWTGAVAIGTSKSDIAPSPAAAPIAAELETAHALIFQEG